MFQFIDVTDFHLMNVIMLEIVALLMEQQPNVFVMMDFRVKIVKVSIKIALLYFDTMPNC